MKIFELLDELTQEIEHSNSAVFSNKKKVDLDVLLEIIGDVKAAVPKEVQEAEELMAHKDQILQEAKEEAASIVASAEDELQSRVCETVVAQEAQAKADELMKTAEANGREITIGAKEYADDILHELEIYFGDYLKVIRKNRLELASKRKGSATRSLSALDDK